MVEVGQEQADLTGFHHVVTYRSVPVPTPRPTRAAASMTPTLFGRIQTRIITLATIGVIWTAIIGPFLPRPDGVDLGDMYKALFTALFVVAVVGIVWELIYHGLQQFRWEKDWPTLFGSARRDSGGHRRLPDPERRAAVGPASARRHLPTARVRHHVRHLVADRLGLHERPDADPLAALAIPRRPIRPQLVMRRVMR